MKFIRNTSTDPYYNMSLDEYCLEQYPSDETFFYLWRNKPSVIVGLNQNVYAEVNLSYLEQKGISLARRVTGGGAVYHDLQNLNYTIVGKSPDPSIFAQALKKLGLDVELTGRNDIFAEGKKISGYARRVWRDREMIHGTLMYDVDIDTLTQVLDVPGSKLQAKGIASVRSRVANVKDLLPSFASLDELQAALQEILSDGDGELEFTERMKAEVRKTADEKFSSWDWIYGHSHRVDFRSGAKLACGRVEFGFALDRGRIVDVAVTGDFIGSAPPDLVCDALKGARYEKDELLARLRAADVNSCFPGVSAEELTDMIFNQHI